MFAKCVDKVTFKDIPKSYFSFFSTKELKNRPNEGEGVLQICYHPKSYFVGELKPNATFQNTKITPSGRKKKEGENKLGVSCAKLSRS